MSFVGLKTAGHRQTSYSGPASAAAVYQTRNRQIHYRSKSIRGIFIQVRNGPEAVLYRVQRQATRDPRSGQTRGRHALLLLHIPRVFIRVRGAPHEADVRDALFGPPVFPSGSPYLLLGANPGPCAAAAGGQGAARRRCRQGRCGASARRGRHRPRQGVAAPRAREEAGVHHGPRAHAGGLSVSCREISLFRASSSGWRC